MTLEVIMVRTPEEKQAAIALRFRVFIDEQKFDPVVQVDEHDDKPTTVHFLGKDVEQDELVAVARVLLDEEKREAILSRVAVLAKCRGKRYGAALMSAIEAAVRDRTDTFLLMAQLDKRGFYEKCGYERLNDEIQVNEGVEHCWMAKSAAD